jgi:DNA-binding GntR family transcriptional regulator
MLIWTLIETSDGGVFPPRRSTPPSIAALARRFGVSRIHIRRMLDDAQRAGILTCEADGSIVFAESQYAMLTYLYAMQLLQLLTAASGAMDALAGDVAA